jgi:hypothetical protein
MAKVPVTTEPELRLGRTVPLGDVAELTFSHPPLIGDAFVNGASSPARCFSAPRYWPKI